MAATVIINRTTGTSPGADTDITGINTRANAEDAHSTAGTTNPIRIPSSGTNYSYWVTTRLEVSVTPAGTIDNLRWFTDGANSFGTGVTATGAKASTGADAGYREATGTPGTTGTQLLQANHSGLDEAPVDIFTLTSGSPKSLTGTITNPSTGSFGDNWVYQLEVDNTAGPGATTGETFTWRYDET
jgi:hypothetical protein